MKKSVFTCILLRLRSKCFFHGKGAKRRAAFTLIELLVVIVIIGILATISVAQFNKYQEKARRVTLTAQITQEKKIYLAECVLQGKDICPVNFNTRKKDNNTNYDSSALECEQVCADNEERLATIEESLWFSKNATDNCSAMWHYVDNTATTAMSGYSMYYNRTTAGCGLLNTGDVARFRVWEGGSGTIFHVSEIYPIWEHLIRDINDTPANVNCACISYPNF